MFPGGTFFLRLYAINDTLKVMKNESSSHLNELIQEGFLHEKQAAELDKLDPL